MNLRDWWESFLEKHALKLFVAWVVILTVLYSTLSLVRHMRFQSGGFDLGLFDQAIWQYAHGIWPYNTIKERFILGDHLTLTLPLLAPLYWLWDDVRILLVFQAAWISLSALPIYLLVRLRKFSPGVSLALAFVYSLFYGIQYAVFFDFHPVVVGAGMLAWLAYFMEAGKKGLFFATLVTLLATQENMGIAVASLGLIYVFYKRYRKHAFLLIVGGFLYSLVASRMIALLSPVGYQYWPQISLRPQEILLQYFDTGEKRQVWFYSFSWFSFLPLLSPGAILAVLLDLGQYFVTGPEFSRMWSPFMHHRAILAPFLTIGTLDVLVMARKKKVKMYLLSIAFVVTALMFQYLFHYPLNKLTKSVYWEKQPWVDDNRALLAFVPSEASVATQQNLVPHLSHRRQIYLVWPRKHDFDDNRCGERTCWWLDFGGTPQYVVVDTRPHQWLTQILESNENYEAAITNMERAGKIQLVDRVNAAKLYRILY